mgnify:CR=1 FL=1
MKIFLTGGSGFIGKNFYKLALKKGHFIYATSRKKRKNRIKNMKWLKGNINFNWKKELSDSDILIHMASTGINKEYNEDKYNTNVFKSLELIKNCIRFKCKNWLIISTSSEYGIRLNDKRIKQIKSDFYNQGYIDGSEFVSKSISEHFKTKWEIDKSINSAGI